jgi:magnesium-transporting ATPase (P-type)
LLAAPPGVGYAPVGTFTTEAGQPLEAARMEAVKKVLECGALCNDSALTKAVNVAGQEDWAPQGAPTEVALITAAGKAGIDVKVRY